MEGEIGGQAPQQPSGSSAAVQGAKSGTMKIAGAIIAVVVIAAVILVVTGNPGSSHSGQLNGYYTTIGTITVNGSTTSTIIYVNSSTGSTTTTIPQKRNTATSTSTTSTASTTTTIPQNTTTSTVSTTSTASTTTTTVSTTTTVPSTTTSVSTTTTIPPPSCCTITFQARASPGNLTIQNSSVYLLTVHVNYVTNAIVNVSKLPYSITVPPNTIVGFDYIGMFNSSSYGTQYNYASTSGCGAPNVPSGQFNASYNCAINASYDIMYYLHIFANNTLGTVSANPTGNGFGFYRAGSQVTITAAPTSPNYFWGWTCTISPAHCYSSAYQGPKNPATVTMDTPVIDMAEFSPYPFINLNANSTANTTGTGPSLSLNKSDTSLLVAVAANSIISTGFNPYTPFNSVGYVVAQGNASANGVGIDATPPSAMSAIGSPNMTIAGRYVTFCVQSGCTANSLTYSWNGWAPGAYEAIMISAYWNGMGSPTETFRGGPNCATMTAKPVNSTGTAEHGYTEIDVCHPPLPSSGSVSVTMPYQGTVYISATQLT